MDQTITRLSTDLRFAWESFQVRAREACYEARMRIAWCILALAWAIAPRTGVASVTYVHGYKPTMNNWRLSKGNR